jgi:hypothetical protein
MKSVICTFVVMLLILCFQSTAWSETYTFQRSIVIFANGEPTIDSLRGDTTLQGTLTVDGATIMQNVTICLNDTNPPTCTSSGDVSSQIISVGENNRSANIMQPDGSVVEIILLSLNPLITVANVGSFVEINQWVLTDPLSSTSNQAVENAEDDPLVAEFSESGKFGSTMTDALYSLGLIPSP